MLYSLIISYIAYYMVWLDVGVIDVDDVNVQRQGAPTVDRPALQPSLANMRVASM